MIPSSPWRYRCPECDSVQVVARTMKRIHGSTAETRYRCRKCESEFNRPLDKKTGMLV